MKLAIVSDNHLGFGRGTPREEDAFFGLKQAIEGIIEQKPDVVIHTGDLFDHKIPSQESWHECFELFGRIQNAPDSEAKVMHHTREGKNIPFSYRGIPIIAIAGTHEYRPKDLKNAFHVLQAGNFLVYLHASHAILEKDGEQVFIHGMSGIPDKRALQALKLYNPIPVEGVHNLLLLHQTIKDFIPVNDDMVATIGLEDLPFGFDLIINGHIHWHTDTEENGKRLLIPGSTLFTQMKKLEGKKKKGWFLYDTETKQLTFNEIPKQRKLFYYKLKFNGAFPEEIVSKCRETIENDLKEEQELTPLCRLRIEGKLAKGYTQADVNTEKILEGFEDKAIFSFSKKFNQEQFSIKLEELRSLHENNVSIAQMGIDLLEKNILRTDLQGKIDVKRLFELLEDKKNVEKVSKLLQEGELVSPNSTL
jgi:DNA repair exonuclease SbcCD nuclease subunit